MTRAFPLQPLLEVSKLRLDEAGRKLGELLAGEREASRRHGLLVEYREEYRTRFALAARDGLRPSEWRNYANFLARLDEAVNQAVSAVTDTKRRTVAGQKEWVAKQGRVKAFETLSDRHWSRIAYEDLRREQKLSDEHGARRHDEKAKE